MSAITIRPKHQVTLPAKIIREARLATNDKLEVAYTNGAIVLTPSAKVSPPEKFDLMGYAGLGKGIWGDSAEEVDEHIRNLRS